ncbi:MAG: site-specific DNA-methyltransferase, partial [Clostridiaceae bacterium]|nr:site-specific DNA-methyltransferase [Clostridiaceae bacterium]
VMFFYSKNHNNLDFIKKYIENTNFKPLVKREPNINEKLTDLGLSTEQQLDLLHFINHENRPERYPIEDTWNCNEYDDLNSIAIVSFSGEKISKILEINQEVKGQKFVHMLKRLSESTTVEDEVILDFFYGTGSTAHAVMHLNSEDGGERKFIMVQLAEKIEEDSEAFKAGYENICEIGKERIRRAGEKIKAEHKQDNQQLKLGEEPKAIPDIGFRVLKLAESNMKDVYYSAGEYDQTLLDQMTSNIKEDRTGLDLLYGCLLEWGLPLSLPHTQEEIAGVTVHTYNEGDLIACFSENVSESLVKEIANRQPLRVVFRDGGFADSPARINVEEIFRLLAPNTSVKVI